MIISTMSSFNQLQQDVSLFEKFEKKDRLSHAEIKNKAVASAIMLHDRFPGNLHRCLGCGVCNLLCSRKTDIPKVIFEVREMLDHYPELEDVLKVRNGNKDNRTEE